MPPGFVTQALSYRCKRYSTPAGTAIAPADGAGISLNEILIPAQPKVPAGVCQLFFSLARSASTAAFSFWILVPVMTLLPMMKVGVPLMPRLVPSMTVFLM